MRNAIKTEVWKATHNRNFYSVLAIGLLISILDVIQNIQAIHHAAYLIEDLLNHGMLINSGLEGYGLFTSWIAVNGFTFGSQLFYLVWPILAAIPFGYSYYQERHLGVFEQIVNRVGKNNYFVSKYCATFVSGGVAIAVPVIINLLCLAQICPDLLPKVVNMTSPIANGWFLSKLYYTKPWFFAVIWCAIEFLWGGATACMCLVAGTKAKHVVSVLLAPFGTFIILEALYSLLGCVFVINIELSPIQLVSPATLAPNPAWVEFIWLCLLTFGGFLLFYIREKKNELV